MPFFKSSPKGPQELAKSLRDSMQTLCGEEGGKKSEKVTLYRQKVQVYLILFEVTVPIPGILLS